MALRRCPQCGATVEAEDHVLATACAFCESPLVDAAEDAEPVDRVVSFRLDRPKAAARLQDHIQSRWFVHPDLKRATRPQELRPVLVPHYAWDAVARTEYRCDVGIYWYRTESYTTWRNGKRVRRTRRVRETEWFPFSGHHGRTWYDHLTCASRGIPAAEAAALEPWDLGRALPWAPSLAAGVEAEHPTVDHPTALATARQSLADLEARVIGAEHLPGDTHRRLKSETAVEIDDVDLVLLPIWIAVYQAKGPVRLLVNGQTGEVAGKVPRSAPPLKVILAALGVLLLLGLAIFFLISCVGCVGALVEG